jgi:hypothetical protein
MQYRISPKGLFGYQQIELPDKQLKGRLLLYSGQLQYWDVLYAVQGIQKSVRIVFHTLNCIRSFGNSAGIPSALELSLVEREGRRFARKRSLLLAQVPSHRRLPIRARAVLRSINAAGTEIHA